jgi:hypothetical protein
MSDDSQMMSMGSLHSLSVSTDQDARAEFNSLMTMMFAIDSILKKSTGSKPSDSKHQSKKETDQIGDPSLEVRRLCVALDEFFDKDTRHSAEGKGYPFGRLDSTVKEMRGKLEKRI